MEIKTKFLKQQLLKWYKLNKREFSWRKTNNPWKILLIETLSQQTQLERADAYYKIFVKEFPTPLKMAMSSKKKILQMWSGLGYNNRALRLYESSKILSQNGFDQIYPKFDELPGVGKYTKDALLSFAYGDKVIAEDTHVNRIITRYFGVDDSSLFLKNYSKVLLQRVDSRSLNQAFMDFGIAICKSNKPLCKECPLEISCSKNFIIQKKRQGKFIGSNRELRGKILKYLLKQEKTTIENLCNDFKLSEEKIEECITTMKRDGLVQVSKNNVIAIISN